MNKKLRELGHLILGSEKNKGNRERYETLFKFCMSRDRSPSWYNRLPGIQKRLWSEVRAEITVGLHLTYEAETMSKEDLQLYFYGKTPAWDWSELEDLALELIEEKPIKTDQRWLEGVWERYLTMLKVNGEPWTKEHAKSEGKGLLESTYEPYKEEYKKMVQKAIDMGIE